MRSFAFKLQISILTSGAFKEDFMRNQLMAVIHAVSESQVLRNARLAFNSGADGVFLINHDIEAERLVGLYCLAREDNGKDKFIGVNFRHAGNTESESLKITKSLNLLSEIPSASAIWFDSIGYKEPNGHLVTESAIQIKKIRHKLEFMQYKGLVFGGLAFKGQPQPKDLPMATRILAPFVDVLTTSGPHTGEPPTLEKVATIREAAPQARIAVASGMTPENVEPFLPYVDYFLVNTGISKTLHPNELDQFRVRLMSNKIPR